MSSFRSGYSRSGTSYARDGGISERMAVLLHEQLQAAGIVAFRDVETIEPGNHWATMIEQQILASQLMLVLVSKDALDPHRWVMRECLFAASKRIPIMPLLVESVELPLWLTHINALDFTKTQPWNRLLLAVGKYVTAVESVEVVNTTSQSSPWNRLLLGVGKAAAEVFGATSKPQEPEQSNALVIPDPVPKPRKQPDYSPEVQQLLQDSSVLPPRRLEIGNRLNELGDPRQGVGLAANGLPDIDWVEIPAGEFIYQQGERLTLPTYSMSRYPVTNTQFQAFIAAGGYETDRWWEGLNKPDDFPNHEWAEGNRPVESVDWYECIAFCRWLSAKLGYEVRLPTEQEWEKAARGEDGREYPWGEGYKTGAANIDETDKKDGDFYLQQTSAVGLYPQGQSPYGLQDMAGNVWEWCLNQYKEPSMFSPDGSDANRVVRGGSWYFDSELCRSSFRNSRFPNDRGNNQGFRLCCFPPIEH